MISPHGTDGPNSMLTAFASETLSQSFFVWPDLAAFLLHVGAGSLGRERKSARAETLASRWTPRLVMEDRRMSTPPRNVPDRKRVAANVIATACAVPATLTTAAFGPCAFSWHIRLARNAPPPGLRRQDPGVSVESIDES